MQSDQITLAIVGPKGGVGKSIISANLATAFAKFGKKTIAVDLDLGGANLQAMFGIKNIRSSLDDFILRKSKSLSEALTPGGINNLSVIFGGSGLPGIANIPYQVKKKIIRHILKLDAQVLLIDLGAGSSYNVIDFLSIVQTPIIVTTPEITSLMNVYGFLKAYLFRNLTFMFKHLKSNALLELLEKMKDPENNPHLKTMDGFLHASESIAPEAAGSIRKFLNDFKPAIVVNRAKKTADSDVGQVLDRLMIQYLNVRSNLIHVIPEDDEAPVSIVKMTPLLVLKPESVFCQSVVKLAEALSGEAKKEFEGADE